MSLSGQLSTYPTGSRQYPYFHSGELSSAKAVVFLGGLTNGMMLPGYVVGLSGALARIGWGLVQMHWSSAYDGYGTGSLDRDRQEMADLVAHLRSNGMKTIVLMGHSTGSQDVIHYLSSTAPVPPVEGGIMQGPASDREHFEHDRTKYKSWFTQLPIARKLMDEGRGEEILDKAFCDEEGCRMSAYRTFSLGAVGGDDDYFSSDLPLVPDGTHAHPLSESFGRLSAPALALYSEHDEFGHLPDQRATLQCWADAAHGRLTARIIAGANHGVESEDGRARLYREVVEWLKKTIE